MANEKDFKIRNGLQLENNQAIKSKNVAGATRSLMVLGSDNVLRIKGNDSEGSSNVLSIAAGGNVTIAGNLTVNGTQTVLNTATLSVDDLNITIADGAADAAAANGAGITVDGANATLTYTSAQDEWNFNKNLVVGGKETTASFPLMVKSDSAHRGLSIEENSGAESWQIGVDVDGDLNFYNSGSTTPSVSIDDDGKMGIGYQAPGYKLAVNGNINAHAAYINSSIIHTGDTDTYINYSTDTIIVSAGGQQSVFKGTGNVGIGESDPDNRLHVNSGTTNVVAKFESSDSQVWINLHDSNSGTYGALLGHDGGSDHLFIVADQSVSKKLVIDNSGKVGIGGTDPKELLTIGSAGSGRGDIGFHVGGHRLITFGFMPSDSNYVTYAGYPAEIRHDPSSGKLRFGVDDNNQAVGNGATVDTILTLTKDKNAGIGEGSPASKLSVAGTIRAEGFTTITAGGAGTEVRYDTGAGWGGILAYDRGNSAYKELRVEGSIIKFKEAGADVMVIDDNKVGIGTGSTTPGSLLHLSKTDTTTYDPTDDSAQRANGATILLENNTATLNSFGQIAFDSRNSGQGIARIVFLDRGSATTDIAFVTENSDTKAEKMRITAAGNVGIGTSSPQTMLQVVGSASSAGSTGGTVGIKQKGDTENDGITITSSHGNSGRIYKDSNGNLHLYNTGGNPNDFVITNTGNVGVGEPSPSAPLHVSGNIKSTGDVIADTHHTSSDGNVTLSSSGSGGNVYLRPNGKSTSTGQTYINSNGQMQVNTVDTSHGLKIAQSTNTGYAPASILLEATQSTNRGGGIFSYNTQSDNGWYFGSLYNNTNLWAVTFNNGTTFDPSIAQTAYSILTVDGTNGRVGIGENAPSYKLSVNSGTSDWPGFFKSTDDKAGIIIQDDDTTAYFGAQSSKAFMGLGAGALNTNLIVDGSGNVGIGTTSPSYQLDINPSASPTAIRLKGTGHASILLDRASSSYDSNVMFMTGGVTKWRLWNDGSDDVLQIRDEANGANVMTWKTGGSVGIGIDNPSSSTNLHLQNSNGAIFRVDATDGGSSPATTSIIQIYGYEGRGAGLKIRDSVNSASGASDREWFVGSGYGQSGFNIGYASDGVQSSYSNQNKLAISTSGAVTFNGAYTFPTSDGSANQVLQTDGSGNLSFANASGGSTDSITDADGDTKIQVEENTDEDQIRFDAAGTERMRIGSDVQIIGTTDFNITGSSRRLSFTVGTGTVRTTTANSLILATDATTALTLDSSQIATFANHVRLADSKILQLGNSQDFQIHHNGTTSYVRNYTGNLQIINEQDDGDIAFYADDGSGGLTTYFYIDGGNTNINFEKNLYIKDNVRADFGSGSDLRIYHNGNTNNSNIENYTGGLFITNYADDEDIVIRTDDGSGGVTEYMRFDGATTEVNLHRTTKVDDNFYLGVGAGPDLYLMHDGTNSHIRNNTGNITIQNNTDDGDIMIRTDDGSGGTTTYMNFDGSNERIVIQKSVTHSDNVRGRYGASNDLQIYHDAADSRIENSTGDLFINNKADDKDVYIQSDDSAGGLATYLHADGSEGSLKLYNYGNKKLETKSYGLDVIGRLKLTDGLIQADEDSQKVRQYHIETLDAGGSFLLGQIENNGSTDGGVEGIVRFAYDFGSTTNNCAIHFNFAQRSGTARGTWWYEHDDQDGSGDRVHVRLIDDGSGNMYVWVTCVDYAETFIEANWRHGANIADSGTLSSGTLTTGTTLFDTANDPTSEMHIGRLYAHDHIFLPDNKVAYFGTGNDLQI